MAKLAALPVRLFRRAGAAQYCGVSLTKFDELVKVGGLPSPRRIDGCVLWDVRELDTAIDALLYDNDDSPFDEKGSNEGWGA